MSNRHSSIGKHVRLIMVCWILSTSLNHIPLDPLHSRASIILTQVSIDSTDLKKTPNSEENNNIDPSGAEASDRQAPSEGHQAKQKQKKTYKTFSPSEKIDVDQAVDFPADI